MSETGIILYFLITLIRIYLLLVLVILYIAECFSQVRKMYHILPLHSHIYTDNIVF